MWLKTYFCAFLACVGTLNNADAQTTSCNIYCEGELLKTVQMARIFPDSKTFVDMEMLFSPEIVQKNFDNLMVQRKNTPSKEQIEKFVKENFRDANEMEEWKPLDFNPDPPFLNTITEPTYRSFIKDLVQIWAKFGRTLKPDVFKVPERYSIIPVPNGFVIPGGRFKEFYYWDSYWIIKGLLASDMQKTVRGMIENFLSMVERYGFVPNGGRVYYLNRSQPPLLNLMVYEYMKATNDLAWLKKNLHLLQKELKYWLKTQTVTFKFNGVEHSLAHYAVESPSPRPESYREDVNTCAPRKLKKKIKDCYKDLKSGAETGWDFSSRWIVDKNGGFDGNLTSIKTRRIIPVDLNSFLAQAFSLVSNYSQLVGDTASQKYWMEMHNSWKKSIHDVLYNQEDGIWYDLDLKLLKHRRYFFPSNLTPLWSYLVDSKDFGDLAVKYLKKIGILDFPGGVPTSLLNTGEQWDLPNAWPPLQSLVIMGLQRSGSEEAMKTAKSLADKWLYNNLVVFNRTGFMYEKYNAESIGVIGGGGEYSIQTGFGWSNGEIFELVEEFYTKK